MFVSVGVRFEANVEALNMVESVGNYTKHRRVPYIVLDEEGRLKTIYVPAVSGESIAHAYQELLVSEAMKVYGGGAPVCEDCARGEFFKSMNKDHLRIKGVDPSKVKEPALIEEGVIKACLVEDIGGFLYAENPPVRRSSAFQVSYALPTKDVAVYSVTEPQLHARHAKSIGKKGEGASEQMIYYVETGTALYAFTFNLDLGAIGVSGVTGKPVLDEDEIKRRRLVALKALLRLLSSQQFGAKLSRFFPVGGVLSTVVALTKYPFAVSSPIYKGFIADTAGRIEVLRERFGEEAVLVVYDRTEGVGDLASKPFVVSASSPEEALAEVVGRVEEQK